jgi:hypothetical protein
MRLRRALVATAALAVVAAGGAAQAAPASRGTGAFTRHTFHSAAGDRPCPGGVVGDGPFTDPLGPDVSAASYDFFSHHAIGKEDCRR